MGGACIKEEGFLYLGLKPSALVCHLNVTSEAGVS